MALILAGGLVSEIRGSIGSHTFARNRSGAYARNRTVPINPATPAQVIARANMSSNVASWQNDLTVAQRETWNDAAALAPQTNRLGQTIHLTGQNWYIRANQLLLLTGQTAVTAPPVNLEVPGPALTLAWTTLVGIQATAIGNWDNSATGFLLMSFHSNLRQTINFHKSPYPQRLPQDFTAYDTLPVILIASADLVANTRSFFTFTAVHADGGTSAPTRFLADVGTPV